MVPPASTVCMAKSFSIFHRPERTAQFINHIYNGINPKPNALLHRTLRSHNTSSKKLTNNAKSIFRALELTLEKLMLIRRFHLSFANCLDSRILGSTNRAFGILIYFVQTALVERVFAEEVDCWKVQSPSAGHAPASLEDDRFAP